VISTVKRFLVRYKDRNPGPLDGEQSRAQFQSLDDFYSAVLEEFMPIRQQSLPLAMRIMHPLIPYSHPRACILIRLDDSTQPRTLQGGVTDILVLCAQALSRAECVVYGNIYYKIHRELESFQLHCCTGTSLGERNRLKSSLIHTNVDYTHLLIHTH
jgi:hypothetical protein